MRIRGVARCLFEQSGTFKREFIRLGIPAEDYDIQDRHGETDHVTDLFHEIGEAYGGRQSVFDWFSPDDLLMAFFPCIYFECMSMIMFQWDHKNYKRLSVKERSDAILARAAKREEYFGHLVRLATVAETRGLRLVVENPWTGQHYLKQNNFVKQPDVVDMNRRDRGDWFVKPTAYWFFNCKPVKGRMTKRERKEARRICDMKPGEQPGVCCEERSLISPDYARSFIMDFILGTGDREDGGDGGQPSLF